MSKNVVLNIEIDENGKVHSTPEGTVGEECLNLMAFLEKIPGFSIEETVPNEDMKKKNVQIAGKQKVKN